MIYYESEHVTIKYFEQEKLVYTKYYGFTPSAELRKILAAVLDLVSKKDVELGLADNSNMKVIRPVDQEYINTVWFPEFLRLSHIRKSATIESSDIFNRMSTENILQTIGELIPFEYRYFGSTEDACSWLGIDPKILER